METAEEHNHVSDAATKAEKNRRAAELPVRAEERPRITALTKTP